MGHQSLYGYILQKCRFCHLDTLTFGVQDVNGQYAWSIMIGLVTLYMSMFSNVILVAALLPGEWAHVLILMQSVVPFMVQSLTTSPLTSASSLYLPRLPALPKGDCAEYECFEVSVSRSMQINKGYNYEREKEYLRPWPGPQLMLVMLTWELPCPIEMQPSPVPNCL